MAGHSVGVGVRRRLIALLIGLLGIATAYVLVCLLVLRTPPAQEVTFEQRPQGAERPLSVYAEVLSVDPVRASLELRLDFATGRDPLGTLFAGPADRDMTVRTSDGTNEQQIALRRGQPMSPVSVPLDIKTGAIDGYPFDRYTADLAIEAYEGSGPSSAAAIPLRLTIWDRLAAWHIGVAEARLEAGSAGLRIGFRVRRPDPHIFLATTLYAVMVLMATIAISAGSLMFLAVRRPDTTLAAVLGTMVFSLPVLRNIMPGAPPLGVRADSFVFLWTELAVVTGLALVVATWARRG
ncbi:MAG TPA: DUF4436 family protein [Dongiaceae bacterium]|nr:DUF4436 family protein [Dongiaceae bacterium]